MDYTEDELIEICEDCFVAVKEACMKLQEKTNCPNQVIIEMLNNVSEYYQANEQRESL